MRGGRHGFADAGLEGLTNERRGPATRTSETDQRRGLAILADEFLELLLEITKHALVALRLLVRQEADGHAFHHVAAEIEAEKKFLPLALPFREQLQAGF